MCCQLLTGPYRLFHDFGTNLVALPWKHAPIIRIIGSFLAPRSGTALLVLRRFFWYLKCGSDVPLHHGIKHAPDVGLVLLYILSMRAVGAVSGFSGICKP